MACGCGKRNLVATTTAQAEAMMASAAPSNDRYMLDGGDQAGERFASYVAAKRAKKKSGGEIKAL